ncbi:acetyl-CoA hydrolase/transferase C-terminal domain-containing protein [Bradyrhizobium sp. WYCCWR 13022]|uniref:acetyl-CoA hydrolase/transferase family protein n=1 Tax=unclassified Bradyrhizobium TaxID=2631580 RepID=UPI00263B08F0|nr:acetyl-CoA hydrolase/transferase C-terminal domain-containing protein [Bradyrhizobium sp. WYCCWR 13022]MDN4984929.1 acetyl-CoA hydrolase/transferase C-terminal domain-containing protein [Bradyrhizobium sp. WYCCWR 13022]
MNPDFRGLIREGDLVVCGQATAEPLTLTEALMAQAGELPAFRMMVGPIFSDTFSAARAPNVSFQSYGVIGNARRLARAGRLDVIPSNYSAFCADFASRRHKADVVLVQLAESGDGRLSASLSNDYVIDAARGARLVIAEINPDAPFTFGTEWPDDIPIHMRVAARRAPVELGSPPLDDISRRIAAHAASLIPDGSTLQFGVGRIPDAILSSLSHVRDLGIHSGLINDAVVDLIERGAVTNAKKGIDAGITVTNQVIGTGRLYGFVHENKAVSVRPTSYTHGQGVLARINRLVAINSALQVGLDGSVNSETLNGIAIGAIGGQLDFVRGANASAGGRAIIALPATASDGTSRIVARVETVTTPRADVDAIVTEWGIAELRGCGLAARARRMIAIAAPEHRDVLSAQLRDAAG